MEAGATVTGSLLRKKNVRFHVRKEVHRQERSASRKKTLGLSHQKVSRYFFYFHVCESYKTIDYCHYIVIHSKLNVKSNAIQQMQLSLLAVLGLSPKKLMFQNPKQNGLK